MRRRIVLLLAGVALLVPLAASPASAETQTHHHYYPRQAAAQTVQSVFEFRDDFCGNSSRIRLMATVSNATATSVYVRTTRIRVLPRTIYHYGWGGTVYGHGMTAFTYPDQGRIYPVGQVTDLTWTVNRTVRLNGRGDSLVLSKGFFPGQPVNTCFIRGNAVFHFR
jgi:hypothetical protein